MKPTIGTPTLLELAAGPRPCAVCGERDIPPLNPARASWLWGTNRGPVHPWCDPKWRQLSLEARRQIMVMVDKCRKGLA